jgi:hypothetical protein
LKLSLKKNCVLGSNYESLRHLQYTKKTFLEFICGR